MPLELITQPPQGPLWINPQWNPDKPGTFSLVIGVSKYDYLPTDKEQCNEKVRKRAMGSASSMYQP